MSEMKFCVDEKLCVTACTPRILELLGTSSEKLLGSPYFHAVLPFVYDKQDAVAQVIRSGQSLVVPRHRVTCFNRQGFSDVLIEPLVKAGDCGSAVQVTLTNFEPCPKSNPVDLGKRWDDMAKVVAMLSHGVRNPLNAIKGAVTYLQRRYADEDELNEFADIMVEEISRLEQFISGFLSTSCQGPKSEPVDVNALLKKIVAYTSLQAQAAGVVVSLDCDYVGLLNVHSFHIEQAILNVINNAMAVLPSGGEIALTCRSINCQGIPTAVIEIVDNGPGMPVDKIAALNDPASEPEGGGDRGFGLFITREVLSAYGGSMQIVSDSGKGTSVRLRFPLSVDKDTLQDQK